jgi:serine/threonine protein kinase
MSVMGATETSRPASALGTAFGRFRLLHLLGQGGMAEVWKAVLAGPGSFNKVVVVKRVLPELVRNAEFVEMFAYEAQISARLNHANIAHVFEFSSVDGGELYMAMEFIDGVNLSELLRLLPDRKMPIGMVVGILVDVARALGYAHELTDDNNEPLGIIHRDVSPSNVMVGFDGTSKLVDFGIAKALTSADSQTKSQVLKGKMGYLSPEAIDGIEIDHRADLFSVGVVLHELLVGRRLFKAADDLKTMAMVRRCAVEPPSVQRTDTPPDLDRICMKLLQRNREQRYASGAEVDRDLTRVLHQLQWAPADTAAFLKQNAIRSAIRESRAESTKRRVTSSSGTVAATPASYAGMSIELGRPRARWRRLVLPAVTVAALAAALLMGVRHAKQSTTPIAGPPQNKLLTPEAAQPAPPPPPSSPKASPPSEATPLPQLPPAPVAASVHEDRTHHHRSKKKSANEATDTRASSHRNKIDILHGDIADEKGL